MVGDIPLKFRILEIFNDSQPHWNYEVVKQIQKEYNAMGDYQRDSINFDIIELASGGMLKEIETEIDKKGIYKKDFLLHEYIITDLGKLRASDVCIYHS